MASKQATPTTAPTSSDTPPQYQGSAGPQPQQPIGVPYYIIDPSTGQPAKGPDGQPLRWGAAGTTTNSEDDLRYRGGIPGTRQITQTQSTYQLPRYFDGDEWLPAQLPPDQLAMLQKKMVAAGLLKSGAAQLGIWDVASMSAYKQLLAYANASGLDNAGALDRWGQQHTLDPNAGKAPLQVKVSNPDELAQVFRKAVMDTRGEGWDTNKINQMVAAYQGVETGAQQQSYNQQDTGGTVITPPSPTSFAETQVRNEDPLGAQEHDVIKPGGPLDSFKQMIAGW